MNTKERRERITQLINMKQEVSFYDIKELALGVSDMTLRRDLEYLDQNNKIIRVLGGAKSVNSILFTSEADFSKRIGLQSKRKEEIAYKALGLLKEDTSIYIDSGTTTLQFSKIIPDKSFFITTSGLNSALELSKNASVSVMMLGGMVKKTSCCVSGLLPDRLISEMHFDFAFLGVSGYTPGVGFTSSDPEDYALKQHVVRNSECVIILMDSSKIRTTGAGIFTFSTFEQIDYVVSDNQLPSEIRNEMEINGITVL